MILTLKYRNCILRYSFLSLLLIFVSNIVSTRAAGYPPVKYQGNHHVFEGCPFTIVCEASVFDAIKWQKDGYTIKFDHVSTVNGVKVIIDSDKNYTMYKKEANGRIFFHLNVTHARAFHSGTYRCSTFHNNSHNLTVLSGPQLQPVYDFENYKVMEWRQLKLVLKCTNSTTAKLEWRKGDTVIKESEKYKLEPTSLVIEKPTDDETGNYTCTDLASNASVPFIVISRPFARLPDNTIVIEGESLTLECQTGGVPTPTIKWKIGNEILNGSTDRITLKAKGDIADAILYIKEVTMDDRNNYYCIASNIGNYNNMTTAGTAKSMVRVKDKLAALWPFLGICAEVFVLCAIILIYEKKRNKAELEESDTDNSPEQKNTPDHGKDSIRHRK